MKGRAVLEGAVTEKNEELDMNLILLGPPGAGKGTQARLLVDNLGVTQISTGEILRETSKKRTQLGLKIDEFLKAGKLVPDDIVNDIIREKIKKTNFEKGFILDGYPRTVKQAQALDMIVEEIDGQIDHVIHFDLDEDNIVERISGRRQCRQCGKGYHVRFAPPREEGICDRCGGALFQRKDDKKEVIKERLKIYEKQNELLVDYYKKRGKLCHVQGHGSTDEVHKKVMKILEQS